MLNCKSSNSKYGYKIQARLDGIRTLVLLNIEHADCAHPAPISSSPFSGGRIFNEPQKLRKRNVCRPGMNVYGFIMMTALQGHHDGGAKQGASLLGSPSVSRRSCVRRRAPARVILSKFCLSLHNGSLKIRPPASGKCIA